MARASSANGLASYHRNLAHPQPGGRGQYKPEKAKPGHFRKGWHSPRQCSPEGTSKAPKKVESGTVKRELTVLKRVIDHSKRKLGLLTSPTNTQDVKRPVVNDERDVRLEDDQINALIQDRRFSRR
jgi:hypothetical protein